MQRCMPNKKKKTKDNEYITRRLNRTRQGCASLRGAVASTRIDITSRPAEELERKRRQDRPGAASLLGPLGAVRGVCVLCACVKFEVRQNLIQQQETMEEKQTCKFGPDVKVLREYKKKNSQVVCSWANKVTSKPNEGNGPAHNGKETRPL